MVLHNNTETLTGVHLYFIVFPYLSFQVIPRKTQRTDTMASTLQKSPLRSLGLEEV